MASRIALVFRRDKKNSEGLTPIYIRITKNRKVSYIATGIKVPEKYWNDKNSCIKSGYPNSTRANHYLHDLLIKHEEELLKAETDNSRISIRALKEKITGSNSVSFFDVADELLKRYMARKSIGTHDKCRSIVKKLKMYTGNKNLLLDEINHSFLVKYERYLREILGNKTNTVHKDMKFIRRVYNEAIKSGMIDYLKNPFLNYQLKVEKTVRSFLTEEELKLFETTNCDGLKKLELHRDMFVFALYGGGIRISDVLTLKTKDFNGTHLNFVIRKTGNQHSIKLPKKAIDILQDYFQEEVPEAFIFPMLSSLLDVNNPEALNKAISAATAYINKNLKTIVKRAGISKNISFHSSRHSFATLALRKGITIDKVSKLLSHSKIAETQVYAKLINEELDAAMDKFN